MKLRKLLALGAACASLFGLSVSLNAQSITINGEVASLSDVIPADSLIAVNTPSKVTLTICGDRKLEITGSVIFTVDSDCNVTFAAPANAARVNLDGVNLDLPGGGAGASIGSDGDVNVLSGDTTVFNDTSSSVNVTSQGETSEVAAGQVGSFAGLIINLQSFFTTADVNISSIYQSLFTDAVEINYQFLFPNFADNTVIFDTLVPNLTPGTQTGAGGGGFQGGDNNNDPNSPT